MGYKCRHTSEILWVQFQTTAIKRIPPSVHIKIMLILYCSLLSVPQHNVLKHNVHYSIEKKQLCKNADLQLSFQRVIIFGLMNGLALTLPFTSTLRGHCRVINWPNINIVVSQGIGRPKKRKRDGGEEGAEEKQWPSQFPLPALAFAFFPAAVLYDSHKMACLKLPQKRQREAQWSTLRKHA